MLRVVLARTFLFLAAFGFDALAFTTQETQRPCQKKVRVKGGKGGAAGGAIEYAFALYPYCFVGGNEVPPEWTGENSDKDPTGKGACVIKESAIPAAVALIAAGLISLGLNCYLLIYRRTPLPEPLPKSLTPEEVDALVKKQVDTAVDTLKLEEKTVDQTLKLEEKDVDTSSENEKDKAARQRNDDFIHKTFPPDGAANKSEEGNANAPATAAVADKGCCERTITSCFTTCGANGEKTTPGRVVTATPTPATVVAATPTPVSTVVAATPTPAAVVAATPTPATAVASTTPVTTAVPVAGTTPAPGMAAE